MLLMIDNYDSFTYNIVQYFGELGVEVEVHRHDRITVDDVAAKNPRHIVLSPGPCTPNEAGICLSVISREGGVVGKSGDGRCDLGGGRLIKKKTIHQNK